MSLSANGILMTSGMTSSPHNVELNFLTF